MAPQRGDAALLGGPLRDQLTYRVVMLRHARDATLSMAVDLTRDCLVPGRGPPVRVRDLPAPPGRVLVEVDGGLVVVQVAAKARASGDELLDDGLAGLTGLLVSPISWDHHWVWALPVGIALWSRWRGVAFAWTAVFCLGSVSWWTFAGRDDYRLGVGHALLADC